MQRIGIIIFLLLSFGNTKVNAQVNARLLQYPDVSSTQIAFSYGGDIWIVDKKGGVANRLTSAEGEERLPKFSPDGSQIAFSGNYYGNIDVFAMPSMGGLPTRITYHGMSDRVVDWYPDGKQILFASSRESGKQRFSQFYKVSDNGGLPEKLPVPYGEFGSLSADGTKIAYTTRSRVFRTWKRYRGGMAPDVWIFDLLNKSWEKITDNDANNELPMWHENKIYYLSDAGPEQRFNIWSYDLSSKSRKQLTDFKTFDIHFPSLGPEEIVFEAGGKLHLLNLTTDQYKEVQVTVVTDEATLMPKEVSTAKLIESFMVSHDGKRGIFSARGEVFTVPAENGPVINLTQTSGVAERYPSWSPDGKLVAYWSDRSGEYELTVRDLKNGGAERKLTAYGPGFRYQIFWSPDSKKMAFIDKAMVVYVYDYEKNRTLRVDQQKNMFEGALTSFTVSWSPDSRYLAFGRNQDNDNNAVAFYDVLAQKLTQVTSGFYSDSQPVFDPDGKYLYFLTNRNFSPAYSDFDGNWSYPNATMIAAVPLAKDSLSPLAPKNDETAFEEEAKKQEPKSKKTKSSTKKDDDASKEGKDAVKATVIDMQGFEERMVLLPLKGGNYNKLVAVSGKIIYHHFPNTGSDSKEKPIAYYDFSKREEKTIVTKADGFEVSADGKKIMVAVDGKYAIVDVDADQEMDKKMPTDNMTMTVVPREEWKQLFSDAWRFERDYFYDPNMHGLDWNAMRNQYGDLIDNAVTRWDVNYIIGELIGEISASHTYRGGGDTEAPPEKEVGYLGIDWGLKDGAYYVKKIIKGAPWDSEVRAAVSAPGLKIKAGDFILAVNNVDIDASKDPWAAFEGLADGSIELTVNNSPSRTGSWKVLVEPMKDETRLRNLAWIEANRKRVEDATQGKIGYIYVPSTGSSDGQYELVRMFYAQFNKDGLIIDERFNNGGQIPDRFIELLDRKPLAFWAVRDGKAWQWPRVANFGPKVMLINGWSGSGGDAFPDYFRKAGLGPLIGTRTWGGLIGISGVPSLIDGGAVTVPTFRMYNPDGTWFREGHGVDPDLEVEDDPSQLAAGVDPQLEKAIEEIMKELSLHPPVKPVPPSYEKR